MPSTSTQYGNYNPNAVDPYPIESVLAAKAAPDSAQAQTMLDYYQLKNQAGANLYGQELDQQHQFAKQQLAQQLQESYLKAIPDIAKAPGAAGLLASAPGGQGVFMGADPNAIARFVGAADQSTQATNLEHLGAGASSFSTAGMPIPEQSVQGITGLPFKQGTRPDITIQGMKDASKIQAANISAGGKGPKTTYTTTLPFNADGSQTQIATSGVRDPTQGETVLSEHQRQADAVNARRTGQSTTSASGGSGAQLDTNSQAGKAAQTSAMKFLQQATQAAQGGDQNAKAAVDNIRGGMKGSVFNTVTRPDGTYIVGKDGKGYKIGG
jgi:hypothetical protein